MTSLTHLEENLVTIQVFCLPACGADGGAGVGQQGDQLSHFFNTEEMGPLQPLEKAALRPAEGTAQALCSEDKREQ